jgi:DNA mismatch endonuclease (patch repair protein)
MAKIRQPTKLESAVREWLERVGIPHEMYPKVEGRPDVRLILPDGDVYVFVDGCFWHGCPLHYREPKSNVGFWRRKIAGNLERDARRADLPYRWIRVWEHDVRSGEFRRILAEVARRRGFCVVETSY